MFDRVLNMPQGLRQLSQRRMAYYVNELLSSNTNLTFRKNILKLLTASDLDPKIMRYFKITYYLKR